MRNNIISDPPYVEVPMLTNRDQRILNWQTVYNKPTVSTAEKCGCFHCGSTFIPREIKSWLKEEDGPETALCPYCSDEKVIIGTPEFPLSTALLSLLHKAYFNNELEKRLEKSTYAPEFSDENDYLRKGVTFLCKEDSNAKIVGRIRLFPTSLTSNGYMSTHDGTACRNVVKKFGAGTAGGVATVDAYYDPEGYFYSDFITDSGVRLPFEPFSGDEINLLVTLSEQYGKNLKAAFVEPSPSFVNLFVKSCK